MIQLYKHQQDAVNFITKNHGNGALFMEVGTGKTLTAIHIYKALQAKSCLVVCPISLINAAWGEDIKKVGYTYCNLRKEFKEANFYIINYESYYLEKYQDLIRKIKPEMIVLDESSKIKNHSAKITKSLLQDAPNYQYRIVMTGTPAPNDETEYWPQMKFVDNWCLPDSFYKFRNTYFHLQRGSQIIPAAYNKFALASAFQKGFKYRTSDAKRKQLMDKINPYIFWAKKKDCLDLPEQTDEIREITLSPSQMKSYKEMKRHFITEINGEAIAANLAITKLMKLRQITSGFAINAEGEALQLEDNSKLNELHLLLDELGDKQAIIWVNFHKEIDILTEALQNTVTLYSLTKDKETSITDFQTGKSKYLIAHPRSAAHGLTFVNCDTEIFFSLDYSFEAHEQARGRIHRPGQKKKCTYIYLLAKDTIDYDIQQALDKKEELQVLYERITNTK